MANTYKNIVITPNTGSNTSDPTIVFSGGDASTNTDVTLRVYPISNGSISIEGSAGQLFSVTNDLTNSIFAVSDISGIPSLEINANGQVEVARYNGNVYIGSNTTNTYVTGNLFINSAPPVSTGKAIAMAIVFG